jgi:SAM-dependent methyltransferase
VNSELRLLNEFLDAMLADKDAITVLDAGCGASIHVSFRQHVHLVGIDVSPKQLDRNTALDEKIVGDIETYPFAPEAFDVIVAWQVLEHLSNPERALNRFRDALKDGGVLVLSIPNVLSVKGLVTKLTPHRFHIWAYRTVFGMTDAGVDDRGPFPTFLRFSIRSARIVRFARENGFTIEYLHFFEWHRQTELRERLHLVGPVWRLVRSLVRALTVGRVDAERTDFIVVLRKNRPLERRGEPPRVASVVGRAAPRGP